MILATANFHFDVKERLGQAVYNLDVKAIETELTTISAEIKTQYKTLNTELQLLHLLYLVKQERFEEALTFASETVLDLVQNKVNNVLF